MIEISATGAVGLASGSSETGMRRLNGLTPGVRVAFLCVLVGAACLLLAPSQAWIKTWPQALTLPATAWIGSGLTAAFEFLKPPARLAAKLLEYPMAGANRLLVGSPYALTIGVLAALGWHIGGRRMLALVLAGLGFILASGYWIASMNTLALVVVSVPLALVLGGLIGVFAYEFPSVEPSRPYSTSCRRFQPSPISRRCFSSLVSAPSSASSHR